MSHKIHQLPYRRPAIRERFYDISYKKIKQLYIDYPDSTKEEKEIINFQAYNVKQACIEYISDLTISEKTIYLLLLALDKKEYKHIQKRMFEILFGVPNKVFFQMIIDNKGEIATFTTDSNTKLNNTIGPKLGTEGSETAVTSQTNTFKIGDIVINSPVGSSNDLAKELRLNLQNAFEKQIYSNLK